MHFLPDSTCAGGLTISPRSRLSSKTTRMRQESKHRREIVSSALQIARNWWLARQGPKLPPVVQQDMRRVLTGLHRDLRAWGLVNRRPRISQGHLGAVEKEVDGQDMKRALPWKDLPCDIDRELHRPGSRVSLILSRSRHFFFRIGGTAKKFVMWLITPIRYCGLRFNFGRSSLAHSFVLLGGKKCPSSDCSKRRTSLRRLRPDMDIRWCAQSAERRSMLRMDGRW
jgi:hypothetical protein